MTEPGSPVPTADAPCAVESVPVLIPLRSGPGLPGLLSIPAGARGVVAFVHGSGSSRLSPRNRAVAAALCRSGLATLLFDLLTHDEASQPDNVFDVALLTRRIEAATDWARERPELLGLPVGYFGASTGAAAALVAAADLSASVAAVVCRGGRPDLAGTALGRVRAPTLFIVGALDTAVIEMNAAAMRSMNTIRELVIVPGASHLFEEPGALEEVARLAGKWFEHYMDPAHRRHSRSTMPPMEHFRDPLPAQAGSSPPNVARR